MKETGKSDLPRVTPLAGPRANPIADQRIEAMDIRRAPRPRTRRRLAWALGVAAAAAALTLALGRLRAAAPSVDRAGLWIDTVKRGPMLRQVQGQGTLVPTEIRWITAVSPARVEAVRLRAGTPVEADTVLVDLSNPDLELAALEADRQLAQAEAELVNLEASLTNQRLAQESVVAGLASETQLAERRAAADDELAKKGFLSELEMATSRDGAASLAGKHQFEQKRLGALARGIAAQVTAQRQQVERLKAIAQFRRGAVDALHVRAGVAGVLQELTLQPGQSLAAGAVLAKVARPDRLKAEVRIAETQAKDVRLGLPATIDTRNGVVTGTVARIDPAVVAGTVTVDVILTGALPAGARPDLSVEGVIELERLEQVLYVGRPAFAQPDAAARLFKLDDEDDAHRVEVKLGKSSTRTVEIRGGLVEGDRVILSDMSQWEPAERIRLR